MKWGGEGGSSGKEWEGNERWWWNEEVMEAVVGEKDAHMAMCWGGTKRQAVVLCPVTPPTAWTVLILFKKEEGNFMVTITPLIFYIHLSIFSLYANFFEGILGLFSLFIFHLDIGCHSHDTTILFLMHMPMLMHYVYLTELIDVRSMYQTINFFLSMRFTSRFALSIGCFCFQFSHLFSTAILQGHTD